MRPGAHRAARSSGLPYVTAITAGGLLGVAANAVLGASRIRQFQVTAALPIAGHVNFPAVSAFAALIAAAAAVTVLAVWLAARMAASRRRWKHDGPTVLRGDTTSRAVTISVDGLELGEIKRDVALLQARIGRHDTALAAIGEGLITACENSGQEPPELPDMDEEFPTAPVLRLVRGGEEAS